MSPRLPTLARRRVRFDAPHALRAVVGRFTAGCRALIRLVLVKHGAGGHSRLLLALLLGGIMSVLCQSAPDRALAQATPGNPRYTPGKGPPSAALEHYNRGREHYQAGRYRDALQELEVAVNLDPSSPNLVYNVARVYELLGEIDQAIAFYRRYRDMLGPNEQGERERTESTLQRLEGARDHVGDSTPAPVVIERRRGVADAAFWSVASIGALALAGAGATGILALTTEHESEEFRLGKDGGQSARARVVQRADRLALASDVLLIAGASLGITAILLYTLRERTVSETARPLARIDLDVQAWSGGAYLSVRGSL